MKKIFPALFAGLAACASNDHLGRAPTMSETRGNDEHVAMLSPGLPRTIEEAPATARASLWSGAQSPLLGDQRAARRGDILTVVIEIDEEAKISNSTERSRSANQSMKLPQLLGLPQRLGNRLPEGASGEEPISIRSSSDADGAGSIRRSEQLAMRIAATVVEVLPNGMLAISGTQEVRVNYELRELTVAGYVRPADITRSNQISFDKIASARVSYGGRGHISDVQQPRVGQQILDKVLPF